MKQKVTNPTQPVAVIHSDTGLTSLQERCALLLAAGTRITDAAQQVGASRNTLYRWLNQPAFICFYNMAKQEVQQYVEGSLFEMHQQALEGIKASLDSAREEVRLKAAVWVVEKISQSPVGNTDLRKMLEEEASAKAKEDRWNAADKMACYRKLLEEAGLDE